MSIKRNKPKPDVPPKEWPANYFDWLPILLRAVSGFNSCITVALTSVIFAITIYDAVIRSSYGWMGGTEIAMMLSGPVVISWSFVNARSILAAVLHVDEENADENCTDVKCKTNKEVPLPPNTGLITENDVAVERELFGMSTVIMRALAGCISAHVICFGSIIFTWTIRESILTGKGVPGDMEIFLAVIGPIVTSWNFVRASNTLSLLVNSTSRFTDIRKKLSEVIAPSK